MDNENIRVLIAEPDSDVRRTVVRILVKFLSFAEANIVEAIGNQALAELKKREFDIVITCNRLGMGLTGVDLINEVKKLNGQSKIIMISGGEKPSLPQGVIFFPKPFKVEEFKKVIEEALI